jgi:hypothetical protein
MFPLKCGLNWNVKSKSILRGSHSYSANNTTINYGCVSIPEALWKQLPPGAQQAIHHHNKTYNNVPPTSRTAQTHQQITQDNPTTNPSDITVQTSNHQEPIPIDNVQNTSTPRQPFVQQMMSTSNVEPGDRLISQGRMYYRVNTVKVSYQIN